MGLPFLTFRPCSKHQCITRSPVHLPLAGQKSFHLCHIHEVCFVRARIIHIQRTFAQVEGGTEKDSRKDLLKRFKYWNGIYALEGRMRAVRFQAGVEVKVTEIDPGNHLDDLRCGRFQRGSSRIWGLVLCIAYRKWIFFPKHFGSYFVLLISWSLLTWSRSSYWPRLDCCWSGRWLDRGQVSKNGLA